MRRPFIKDGLTAEQLRALLHYDPDTGLFRWREGIDHWRAGLPAGTRNRVRKGNNGYILLGVKRRLFRAHRLAWLYMTGEWPEQEVDHIDTDGFNNAWSNLRLATQSQNAMNRGRRADNTSGHKGVSWNKRSSRWLVHISYGGRVHHIGLFDEYEDACQAYRNAAVLAHGAFARTE